MNAQYHMAKAAEHMAAASALLAGAPVEIDNEAPAPEPEAEPAPKKRAVKKPKAEEPAREEAKAKAPPRERVIELCTQLAEKEDRAAVKAAIEEATGERLLKKVSDDDLPKLIEHLEGLL